ncbi:MAG TPA: hypothetical protein VKS01_11565 [Bryobacteraceae bacterium]|nr:hypothetical protein [Bryobacteraceae bacterium]
MPGMKGMGGGMSDSGMYLMNLASGTSANPQSAPMKMTMASPGHGWSAMFMGTAFLVDTQQSGPRGGDKLFSTSWFMAAFGHPLDAKSSFEADIMLSLEPATVTDRRYPELFQTGETAFGAPIIDGQHPHDFIMALGFHYTRSLAEHATLDLYFAPVGDPALGPVAFPHRDSAAELPDAPISHHLQDSTHIANEVVTAGLAIHKFKIEGSGFHGGEPDEYRWDIDAGAIDSWSARLWYFPGANWAAQVSLGHLTHPEALEPGDQVRSTASISYSLPLSSGGAWSSSLIWGRNHETATRANLNSYLAESVVPIRRKNFITGRIELADKNELSVPGTYRIGAYTIGYTRDVDLVKHLETGIGASISDYSLPDSLKPVYGNHPLGGNIFLRVRLKQ